MSLGGRPCAQGKKRELVPAIPMSWAKRLSNYEVQRGSETSQALTPRQLRRFHQKRRAQESRAAQAKAEVAS
jgi:hypothetical protein